MFSAAISTICRVLRGAENVRHSGEHAYKLKARRQIDSQQK
jgi:hypothetical protein